MRRAPLILVLALVLAPAVGRADPLPVRSGKVVLPITGLAIDLPKDPRKTATWMLSGSWSLSDGGKSFDGRDVIDLKVGDQLVAGSWIHIGYFNAGECAAVVNELDVPDRWTGEADLYGVHVAAAGGTWDFKNDLGKHPAIALCASSTDNQSLLLYRFFLEDKAPAGEAGLAALAKDPLFTRVVKAWQTGAVGATQPTRHPEIKQRGDLAPARTVTLVHSQLAVAIPDDGFVWLARDSKDGKDDDGSDFLDRMAPAVPDISLEIAVIPEGTCDDVYKALTSADGAPKVRREPPITAPTGWASYPTLQLDKQLERLLCRGVGKGALFVGLLIRDVKAPAGRDFAPLTPILQAIADAAAAAAAK